MSDSWRKEGGYTIEHGDGLVSHEVDPVKLLRAAKAKLAEPDLTNIDRASVAHLVECLEGGA